LNTFDSDLKTIRSQKPWSCRLFFVPRTAAAAVGTWLQIPLPSVDTPHHRDECGIRIGGLKAINVIVGALSSICWFIIP